MLVSFITGVSVLDLLVSVVHTVITLLANRGVIPGMHHELGRFMVSLIYLTKRRKRTVITTCRTVKAITWLLLMVFIFWKEKNYFHMN